MTILFLFVFSIIGVKSFNFTLLHTLNLQGTLLGVDEDGVPCPPEEKNLTCFGGVARRQLYINSVRQLGDTVLVDVANSFVGSFFYYFFKGTVISSFFNKMQYDVMSLGAFDFSNGPEKLGMYLNFIEFPALIVASNINVSKDDFLGARRNGSSEFLIQPYAIIQRSDRKIAILGALEDDIYQVSQPGPDLILNPIQNDVIKTLTSVIQRINQTDPDCNIFVLLTSNVEAPAIKIAEGVPGLDVVVAVDGEAKMIRNNWGENVLFVAGGGPSTIGNTYLEFDDQGKLTLQNATLVLLNGTQDNQTAQEVAYYYDQLQANLGQTLVYSETSIFGEPGVNPVDPLGCENSDCAMGWLVADAFFESCGDCDVALVDVDSIAHGLPQGNVTFVDLLIALPTQDRIKTFFLQGEYIVSAIKNSISSLSNRLQVAGIKFAWNPNTTLDIDYRTPLILIRGEPIIPTSYYKVVTTGHLRSGRHNFTMISDNVYQPNDYLRSIIEVVSDYLKLNGTTVHFQPKQTFLPCSVSHTLTQIDSNFVWPDDAMNCRMIRTGTKDLGGFCPTNTEFCVKSLSYGELAPASQDACSVCSGQGICLRNQSVCNCIPAMSGRFAGIKMFQGYDCSDMRQQEQYSIYLLGFMNGFSCVTIVISIFASIMFIYHRNFPAFKAASPMFCQLAATGAGLLGISMLLFNVTTDCMLWLWFSVFGFTLLYGALLVKTYRIYKVFKPFSTADLLSDFTLLRRLVMILILQAGLMFLFQSTAPIKPQIITNDNPWSYWDVCASSTWSLPLALIVYNGGILFASAAVAYKVRGVWSKFNESKYLGISVYNTVFVALLGALVLFTLGNDNPPGNRLFVSISVNYVAIFCLIFLIYPKLRDHYFPHEIKPTDLPPEKQVATGTVGTTRKYKPFRPAPKTSPTIHRTSTSTTSSTATVATSQRMDRSESKSKGPTTQMPSLEREKTEGGRRITTDKKEEVKTLPRDSGIKDSDKGGGLKKMLALDQLHNYMGPEERLRKLEEVKSELTSLLNTIESQIEVELIRQRCEGGGGSDPDEVDVLREELGPDSSPSENQDLLLLPDQPASHVTSIQIAELPSINGDKDTIINCN